MHAILQFLPLEKTDQAVTAFLGFGKGDGQGVDRALVVAGVLLHEAVRRLHTEADDIGRGNGSEIQLVAISAEVGEDRVLLVGRAGLVDPFDSGTQRNGDAAGGAALLSVDPLKRSNQEDGQVAVEPPAAQNLAGEAELVAVGVLCC